MQFYTLYEQKYSNLRDKQTHGRTFRLIESINSEGRSFKNASSCLRTTKIIWQFGKQFLQSENQALCDPLILVTKTIMFSAERYTTVCHPFFKGKKNILYWRYQTTTFYFLPILKILLPMNPTLALQFSKHRPSWPMLSISRNVRLSVCLSVCVSVHFWGTA